jgi:hypothetical protein
MDDETARLCAEMHRYERLRVMVEDRLAREALTQLIAERRQRLREIAPGEDDAELRPLNPARTRRPRAG